MLVSNELNGLQWGKVSSLVIICVQLFATSTQFILLTYEWINYILLFWGNEKKMMPLVYKPVKRVWGFEGQSECQTHRSRSTFLFAIWVTRIPPFFSPGKYLCVLIQATPWAHKGLNKLLLSAWQHRSAPVSTSSSSLCQRDKDKRRPRETLPCPSASPIKRSCVPGFMDCTLLTLTAFSNYIFFFLRLPH